METQQFIDMKYEQTKRRLADHDQHWEDTQWLRDQQRSENRIKCLFNIMFCILAFMVGLVLCLSLGYKPQTRESQINTCITAEINRNIHAITKWDLENVTHISNINTTIERIETAVPNLTDEEKKRIEDYMVTNTNILNEYYLASPDAKTTKDEKAFWTRQKNSALYKLMKYPNNQ